MILLDTQLLKQAEFETEIAEHNFFMIECKKCYGKKLLKKRDCDLLYSYRKPYCKLMESFVEKKTKEINKKMLAKAILDLTNNVKSC